MCSSRASHHTFKTSMKKVHIPIHLAVQMYCARLFRFFWGLVTHALWPCCDSNTSICFYSFADHMYCTCWYSTCCEMVERFPCSCCIPKCSLSYTIATNIGFKQKNTLHDTPCIFMSRYAVILYEMKRDCMRNHSLENVHAKTKAQTQYVHEYTLTSTYTLQSQTHTCPWTLRISSSFSMNNIFRLSLVTCPS